MPAWARTNGSWLALAISLNSVVDAPQLAFDRASSSFFSKSDLLSTKLALYDKKRRGASGHTRYRGRMISTPLCAAPITRRLIRRTRIINMRSMEHTCQTRLSRQRCGPTLHSRRFSRLAQSTEHFKFEQNGMGCSTICSRQSHKRYAVQASRNAARRPGCITMEKKNASIWPIMCKVESGQVQRI